MKVVYLAPMRQEAGCLTAFTFVDEEIRALADAGVEVFVPTYARPGEGLAPYPNVQLCELPDARASRDLPATLGFLRRVRRRVPWGRPDRQFLSEMAHTARIERFVAGLAQNYDVDVIHSNFGCPGGLGGVLAQAAARKPLVATMRGMDVLMDEEIAYGLRRNDFYDRALRLLLRHADATTHVSDFIRHRAIELGARADHAVTIPKGVDCTRFDGSERSSEPGGRPTILTVAGLIRRKGVDVILRALAAIGDERQFDFIVAGDGPERPALESLCRDLGLTSRVRFLGYVDRENVPALFAAADIFVLGSIWEASGNVLIEAQASGCSVVCTDSGGPPEYVPDGETGFVVPARDARTMANRIARLLDDPALRARFGQNARKRAVEHYSYPRMIDDIIGVYRRVRGNHEMAGAFGSERRARATL